MLDNVAANINKLTLGQYTEITEASFPTQWEINKDLDFEFVSHMRTGPPTWGNLAIGIAYVDGPLDNITVDSLTINKGSVAYTTTSVPSVCTSTRLRGTIKALSQAGTYTFILAVGYISGNTFNIDDGLQVKVEIYQPTVAPTIPSILDINQIISMIMPLMMLMLVMGILTSLIRTMGTA